MHFIFITNRPRDKLSFISKLVALSFPSKGPVHQNGQILHEFSLPKSDGKALHPMNLKRLSKTQICKWIKNETLVDDELPQLVILILTNELFLC
jgi:hypothetical protein